MSDLNIALLQTSLVWEEPIGGLKHIQSLLDQRPPADLYVLPEMFTTGFSMQAEKLAESMEGPSVRWMLDFAMQNHTYICGSLIIRENEKYFNRLLVAGPEGLCGFYDKKHLFRMAGEDDYYQAGNQQLQLHIKGWDIRFWICYDLRFPVWMRNRKLEYDLGIIVANWPERRSSHWEKLLPARAIENQAYFAGVNRNGTDGNGLMYSGKSVILSPLGETLAGNHSESGWITSTLSRDFLQNYRNKFEAWKDADDFSLS